MSAGGGFVDFAENLSPPVQFEAGQRAACLVCFDGVEPCELEGDERAWARKLFGDVETVPELARSTIAWVCGGRSGKTYLLNLRGLHLALTVDLSELAPGEEAFVAIIAPTLELAQQGLRYASGAAKADPYIRKLIVRSTADELLLKRADGALVALRTFAASAGGVSGRGKSLIALVLDETCFFRDKASGVVNDEVIFDAASVRVMDGGQTLVASTPWVGRGLLFGLWKRNFSKPSDTLVAHAATRTMRTKPSILAIVERAEKRNAANAAVEFGAEWGSTSVELFFSEDELGGAFVDDLNLARKPQQGERVVAGADLGFTRNSACLALLHETRPTDEHPAGLVVLAQLEERQPTPGKPLKPSAVCKEFAGILRSHGGHNVTADGHYKESLREWLDPAGLYLEPAPPSVEAMTALRAAMREGEIRLTGERLREQLVAMKSRRTVGDREQLIIPTAVDGSHSDAASAVANAAWALGRWGGAEVKKAKEEKIDPRTDPQGAMRQALMEPPKDQRRWLERYRR